MLSPVTLGTTQTQSSLQIHFGLSYTIRGAKLAERGDYCPHAAGKDDLQLGTEQGVPRKSLGVQEGALGRTHAAGAALRCRNTRQPQAHNHGVGGAATWLRQILKQLLYQQRRANNRRFRPCIHEVSGKMEEAAKTVQVRDLIGKKKKSCEFVTREKINYF